MTDAENRLIHLEDKARQMRIDTVKTVYWAGGGHLGGALSVTDILTVLYFYSMRIDATNPDNEDRDRLIMSKGHAGVGVVPFLADLGYIKRELLKTYNHTNSTLGMHLDMRKVPGVDASTGSLGHGLPISAGLAFAAKILGRSYNVFTVLGDGECNEGAVWEAAMALRHYKLNSVITFIDRNRLMYDGDTEKVMALEPFKDKWKSFGFQVLEIDGHNIRELCEAVDKARTTTSEVHIIICNTVKGCGVRDMENKRESHYTKIQDQEMLDEYIKDINEYHDKRKSRWEN